MGKKADAGIFTDINHIKDFAHCKEWGDINVSIDFELLVTFHVFSLYLLYIYIIICTLQRAVSIAFKYGEGKNNVAILSEEAS